MGVQGTSPKSAVLPLEFRVKLGASLPISFAGRVDLPPAEVLGTSTDAVLCELAGCDDDALARLRAAGVIQ